MRTLVLLLGGLTLGCATHPAVDRLDCNSCHASLYDGAAIHATNSYPRTCYQCHGQVDWKDADAAHTKFNISTGSHAGWDCGDCHLSQTDRTQIACTNCHWHTEDRVAPFHIGNSRFTYTPSSCLGCHAGGRRGG